MVAKLVAEEGDLRGLVLSLDEGNESWVIGRDPEECQLVIEDPLTSRRHLIAKRTPEGITIQNLSVTNPTLLNEEQIGEEPKLLQQGDTLKIGNEIFRFYTDPEAKVVESPYAPKQSVPPLSTQKPSTRSNMEELEEKHDTILSDETNAALAEINFGLAETGRWLLKVVGGPNNGAEFYMQANHTYILGTDPHSCDIVFHDTSVSRQHARITVTENDLLYIEDLKSRNGVLISGAPLEGKQTLSPSIIVTLGTTSFVVYDREGEMQTIISPLLPSIVKVLQHEETPETPPKPVETEIAPPAGQITPQPVEKVAPKRNIGSYVLIAILVGLFTLVGLGTATLFKSEPVVVEMQENPNEMIQQALAQFPAVKFSFNKNTGGLLLLGHVTSSADKTQLAYNLQNLNFVKSVDDTGIIIDEFVWQEINSVLSNNPAWRGISVHSPAPGQFVVSGYLETRKEAEQLSDYISINFPYLDLLKKQVVVEEDIVNQINALLMKDDLRNVSAVMKNGEITLTGNIPNNKGEAFGEIVTKVKEIPGVRDVSNYVKTQAADYGIINISDQYEVTGQSRVGDKYTVVINGRILSEGDSIDGMLITGIKSNMVLLEKDGNKYRIDYNK